MKRYAAFLTAFFVIMFSVGVGAASFSDMPSSGSEYYDALSYAVNQGYLTGSDGKILPNDSVTRAQAAAIFVRISKAADKADLSAVTDLASDAWYYDDMARAVKAGLFTAKDGKLYPSSNITRAEGFVLVYKAQLASLSITPASLEGIGDISSLSSEAKTALAYLVGANVLTLSSGKAEPDKSITRAELALWIYNASKATTTQSTETPSEEATEAATEEATEAVSSTYSQQANEAMQLAFGIRSDGTSYIETSPIYRDGMTIIWTTGGSSGTSSSSGGSSSGGSSSGGSSGGSSSGGSSSGDDDSSSATESATSATEKDNEPQETYTGTITNENDNVVEDPFGDNDSSEDDEDEDFIIDDDDYFDYDSQTEATEAETEENPSDTEEETSEPSSEEETDEQTEEQTDMTEEESSEAEDATADEDGDTTAEDDEEGEDAEALTVTAFFRIKKNVFLLALEKDVV